MKTKKIIVKPIGYVDLGQTVNKIIVRPELTDLLDGIGGYSHLYLISQLNEKSHRPRKIYTFDGSGRSVGVLAFRSRFDPNLLSLSMTRLIKRNDNILFVEDLDLFQGTPILSIKPLTSKDIPSSKFTEPDWANKGIRIEKK